jgi:hypothetical protein
MLDPVADPTIKTEEPSIGLKRKLEQANFMVEDDFDDFEADAFDMELETSGFENAIKPRDSTMTGTNNPQAAPIRPQPPIANQRPTQPAQFKSATTAGHTAQAPGRPLPQAGQVVVPRTPQPATTNNGNPVARLPANQTNNGSNGRPAQDGPSTTVHVKEEKPAGTDLPATFVSARAPSLVKGSTTAVAPATDERFDPHTVSPSIRKTSLVNHSVSGPVKRVQIMGAIGPTSPSPGSFSMPTSVNDSTKRVGMPYQNNPNLNRNAYKPPGLANPPLPRAPLQDANSTAVNVTATPAPPAGNDSAKRLKAG